ncbi:hypothetical protein AQPW35_18490 [Rubrivivax pictus]|uniref:Uncharacterized protein n=1 Tax=Pseudaquabacterium pictum TaxID=2315236 RepID=A0A480AVF5_9BURK|nr:hypothetical protein AQPW35_18490 [Rubrivivax pictus]
MHVVAAEGTEALRAAHRTCDSQVNLQGLTDSGQDDVAAVRSKSSRPASPGHRRVIRLFRAFGRPFEVPVRNLSIRPDRRAFFAEQAQRWRQAASACAEASREARGASRLREAHQYLEQAARCLERLDDKAGAFRSLYHAAMSEWLLHGSAGLRHTTDGLRRVVRQHCFRRRLGA